MERRQISISSSLERDKFVKDYSPPDTPPAVSFQREELCLEQSEEDEEQEHTEDRFVAGIRPYMFELLTSEESTNGHLDVEQVHPQAHLDVSQWCSCGCCQNMDTERLCCREVRQVCDKSAE
ncbi:hypothetical protein G5714_002890 [Onychostoma macrolepis]|uniref:Uncharacterized protein n=1 Tax=Onychostoma macrolepis TaxID=369639 RepID=A0A7J6D890_9TELE|nr:hypothetical protein G5714_002890 [Onychostoma macrolepis]